MLQQSVFFAITAFLIPLSSAQVFASDSVAPANPAAEGGYQFLIDTALIPVAVHESTFDEVWKIWPQPLKSESATLSPAERRTMAFYRQGKRPSRMDLGALAIPLGSTNGSSNAVVFGKGLMNARD